MVSVTSCLLTTVLYCRDPKMGRAETWPRNQSRWGWVLLVSSKYRGEHVFT